MRDKPPGAGRDVANPYEEPCGCGLWICKECRPENFDPVLKAQMERGEAVIRTLMKRARRGK